MSTRYLSSLLGVCAWLGAAVAACSPSAGKSSSGDGAGSASSTGAGGGGLGSGAGQGVGSGSGGGSSVLNFGDASASRGGTDAGTCGSERHRGERLPLDIYVMLDISGSMNQAGKWDNVKASLIDFVGDAGSFGMGIGIQYFPLAASGPATCQTDADCNVGGSNTGPCLDNFQGVACGTAVLFQSGCACANVGCTLEPYQVPAVPIAPLPGNAGPLQNSLNAQNPNGFTPTRPALQGAFFYAIDWAANHPERDTVVVLATDGQPTQCTANSVGDVAFLADDALRTHNMKTFVIGVGDSLTNLNQIAASGGTGTAFIVDPANPTAFRDALNSIRQTALSCDYYLPEQDDIDVDKVNVNYTPEGGSDQIVPRTAGSILANCDPTNGGWYYDDPTAPTVIRMCDATCARFNQGGSVQIGIGCATVEAPPIQ